MYMYILSHIVPVHVSRFLMEQGWTGAVVRAFLSHQCNLGSIIPCLNAA